MIRSASLTDTRRGAWIINATKHLTQFNAADIQMSLLENLVFAGRCGSLLIKLSADETEQLTESKVKAHARLCGIGSRELPLYLETLKAHFCLDWDSNTSIYEVLAYSRQRVLTTSSQILRGSPNSHLEGVLPDVLEYCLTRPRLESEVRSFLSRSLQESDVNQLLELTVAFSLLGSIKSDSGERILFNGYQFGDRVETIGKALTGLSRQLRDELDGMLEAVTKRPGIPPENVGASDQAMGLAVGLGLVDVSEVSSPAGVAQFLSSPRFRPPSVGSETSHLEDDVFNHAKMLLSSLRFGELRSSWSRGRIADPSILVSALLGRDRVGPCTAIGQDYVILEGEGVIKTVPAQNKNGSQFYMELRRREPAEMVLGLLRSGGSSEIDARSLPRSLVLPLVYAGPETQRPRAVRKATIQSPESMKRFLEELRT